MPICTSDCSLCFCTFVFLCILSTIRPTDRPLSVPTVLGESTQRRGAGVWAALYQQLRCVPSATARGSDGLRGNSCHFQYRTCQSSWNFSPAHNQNLWVQVSEQTLPCIKKQCETLCSTTRFRPPIIDPIRPSIHGLSAPLPPPFAPPASSSSSSSRKAPPPVVGTRSLRLALDVAPFDVRLSGKDYEGAQGSDGTQQYSKISKIICNLNF